MDNDKLDPETPETDLELEVTELESKQVPEVLCACSTTCSCTSCSCVYWDFS